MASQHSQADNDDDDFDCLTRYILVGLGDTENLEKYKPGGFHPVHLGDTFLDGRYKIIHKIGAGGFSTVWLARDNSAGGWVALKIVVANHSASVETKSSAVRLAAERCSGPTAFVADDHHFTIDGPNGHHLCLVLPLLGPSAHQMTFDRRSRLRPALARKASYQTATALVALHAQGLCHGGTAE